MKDMLELYSLYKQSVVGDCNTGENYEGASHSQSSI